MWHRYSWSSPCVLGVAATLTACTEEIPIKKLCLWLFGVRCLLRITCWEDMEADSCELECCLSEDDLNSNSDVMRRHPWLCVERVSNCICFYSMTFDSPAGSILKLKNFGRLPIELAAEYGTWEDVELLFPVTSKIPTVADWSVSRVISHVYMEVMQLEDDEFVKKKKSELKRQGADAFSKEDYLNASVFYTQALKVDQFDATLFSNRSLCWLRLGDGKKALLDAIECKHLRPKWGKAYYRKGAALMFLEDYDSAYDAFNKGLELDPESEEMENLLWEAMDLKTT